MIGHHPGPSWQTEALVRPQMIDRLPDTQPGERIDECIAAAQQGSREALGRLLELCRPYLLLISNEELESGLHPKAGASDLVQETFLEAQQGFRAFQGTSEPELLAWLRAILRNNLANLTRRYRGTEKRCIDREVPLQFTGQDDLPIGGPNCENHSPSCQVMAREQLEALQRALERLPADYRLAVRLHHQEGRTFEEIGAIMSRSAEAVRKLWSRAIERLQQELEKPT
jgi:RNA polymerase sigma-70 factor (ECF subfamily)